MVNTLSGSVCAYRKETVKPRFIRIDEVMALLDVTQDEAMDIALAAGAIVRFGGSVRIAAGSGTPLFLLVPVAVNARIVVGTYS